MIAPQHLGKDKSVQDFSSPLILTSPNQHQHQYHHYRHHPQHQRYAYASCHTSRHAQFIVRVRVGAQIPLGPTPTMNGKSRLPLLEACVLSPWDKTMRLPLLDLFRGMTVMSLRGLRASDRRLLRFLKLYR